MNTPFLLENLLLENRHHNSRRGWARIRLVPRHKPPWRRRTSPNTIREDRTIRRRSGPVELELDPGRKRHHAGWQRAVKHASRETRLVAIGIPLKTRAHTVVFRMVEHVVGLTLKSYAAPFAP